MTTITTQRSSKSLHSQSPVLGGGRASNGKPPTIKPITGDKPALLIRNRLSNLAQSFSGFEQQIVKIKEKKKDTDEQTIINIKNELQSINNDIKSETRKREETVKAVQSKFETEISETKKDVEVPIYKKMDALIETVHHLSEKIDTMVETHENDRRDFPNQIENKSSDLMKQISEFKAKFESDNAARLEKDKIINKIIEEQNFNITQMLEAERVEREKKLMKMRNDLDLEARMRTKSAKSTTQYVKENVDHLNSRIDQVKHEREEATDELVKAMIHYTAALHDGVKIVSESG